MSQLPDPHRQLDYASPESNTKQRTTTRPYTAILGLVVYGALLTFFSWLSYMTSLANGMFGVSGCGVLYFAFDAFCLIRVIQATKALRYWKNDGPRW